MSYQNNVERPQSKDDLDLGANHAERCEWLLTEYERMCANDSTTRHGASQVQALAKLVGRFKRRFNRDIGPQAARNYIVNARHNRAVRDSGASFVPSAPSRGGDEALRIQWMRSEYGVAFGPIVRVHRGELPGRLRAMGPLVERFNQRFNRDISAHTFYGYVMRGMRRNTKRLDEERAPAFVDEPKPGVFSPKSQAVLLLAEDMGTTPLALKRKAIDGMLDALADTEFSEQNVDQLLELLGNLVASNSGITTQKLIETALTGSLNTS